MKRIVLCLLCFLLAAGLFTACEGTPEQTAEASETTTAPTEKPTEGPTEETTESPTDPPETEPTEPPKIEIGQLWYLDREYPSYEEYYAQRVYFPMEQDLRRWIAGDGTKSWSFEAELRSTGLDIRGDAFLDRYKVPGSEALFENYNLMTADGKYAILQRESDLRLVQVDLLTGEVTELMEEEEIFDCYVPDPKVAYYMVKKSDRYEVRMLYIPERREQVLYTDISADQLADWFYFSGSPADNYAPVTVSMCNPQMYKQLKKEVRNPNSKYKTGNPNDWDWTEIWGEELFTVPNYNIIVHWIAYWIQEDTGIWPYLGLRIQWDGTVQEVYSVIDMCWFGTGLNHNHSDPDAPKPDPIDPVPGEWTDLDPFLWETDLQAVQDIQGFDGNIYILEYGEARELAIGDLCWKQGSENDIFFATYDGRVVRVDGDATLLYDSGGEKLRLLNTDGITLVFIQGNDLMEVDQEDMKIRIAISHENLDYVYFWDYQEPAQIVIEIVSGLHVEQYLLTVRGDRWEETTFI